jgi:anti-sigma regulatory factor (Ser/Thr protein kinase)
MPREAGVPLPVMHTRSSSTERPRAGAQSSHRLHEVTRQSADDARTPRMGQRRSGQHSSMAIATESSEVLLALEPRPESARLARRALASHGLHEDVEHTVTLLATEIVGNAVRHAGLRGDQRIVFFARLAEDYARVEVADQGEGFDPETVQSEGFGLRLLAKLASRWGCDCTDRGCKVWFEVDRRSGRFRRTA